jgi:hypothetical protein
LAELQGRLRRARSARSISVADLEEVLARDDMLVGGEKDVLDEAARLDREIDAARRAGGADGVKPRPPRGGASFDHRDRNRRGLHVGEHACHHPVAKQVHAHDPADDQRQQENGQE